jgi:molecular chaperone GrpE
MSDQTENQDPIEPEDVASEAVSENAVEAEAPIQFDAPDLAAEIADLKDQLLRAKAEVENTRRIAAREKQDASKYALTNFARDILRVADNLGFAMMSVTEEARKADQNLDNLYVGIDMTMKELISVFAAHNIKPVAAEGEAFDHNIHEAVQQVENAEVPSNTVVKALRGGYMLHDRLLRPAQVIVSTGGPKAEQDQQSSQSEEPPAADAKQAYSDAEQEAPGHTIDQET